MIPYEQLVAALASWRQRQGLPAGPADYLGEPVAATAQYDYTPADGGDSAYAGGYGGAYGEDVVELSDEMMDSVVEEQSSPWSVEAVETVDDGGQAALQDTQDEEYLEPPRPEPEPEPEPAPSGRRKRRK
ncbi:MAG TPA: hypothetical protein VFU21_17605 [Kofleriaceae bacterium]|nr:hypothetical protein [Kofleriaceae bacterium]